MAPYSPCPDEDVKGAAGRPITAGSPNAKNRHSIWKRQRRETLVPLQALGYAGFGSAAPEDWQQFGTSLVGWQAVERGNSLLAFRMDDRKQRIVIDRAMGDGARFFGWEVENDAALGALAAKLEAAEVQVTAEPQALADARRVRA